MKKSKKIIALTALIALVYPEFVSATDYIVCGNNNK